MADHNIHNVSFVVFVWILRVCCLLVTVNPSVATEGKSLRQETYYNVHDFKETMRRTAIQRVSSHRRSFKEQGGTGQANVCADIVGSKWQMNKQSKGPCPKLLVWVPKAGFTELVKVEQSKVVGGFSIAIFCYALQLLPFEVQPIFKPFINEKGESNGTYEQLLEKIKGKKCQAVSGDVTIRANRAKYVDFTIPYMSSEVYKLVPASREWNQTLWTFLRPFTWRLWIAITGVCIYIGIAVAILEYRVGNPKFTAPFYQKLRMVIWFPISMFFFNEGKILNRNSKVVLVMWLSMIFIVVQIFTATLSSWLTLDQLRPSSSHIENIGYQKGSFIKDFLIEQYNRTDKTVLPLKDLEEYKHALDSGSVDAIFDELPYIQLFLAKYRTNYMKFGPINQESGIAFAFPRASRLVNIFSTAVINVTESDIMMEMKKKYFGFNSGDESLLNQGLPQSLDVQSFIGLFMFVVVMSAVAIISSEVSIRRANTRSIY